MGGLINLLVTLLLAGLIFYLLYWLIGQIPLPAPFKTVALVILAFISVVFLLTLLFGSGIPTIRLAS